MSKKVNIKIKGSFIGIDYNPWEVGYEYDRSRGWWESWGFDKITSITANGKSITKTTGNYVKDNHFFQKEFRRQMTEQYTKKDEKVWDGGMYIYWRYYSEPGLELKYVIKLDDNEEFDPEQLQFVKSEELKKKYKPFDKNKEGDYGMIPEHFIVADYILYKGEKVSLWDVYEDAPFPSPLYKMYMDCKIVEGK